MGRRFTLSATGARAERANPAGPCAYDIHWAGERRTAIRAASLLLAALLVVDTGAGYLSIPRAALWTGLAALFFVILLPPKVIARPGLLIVRGLLVEHSVRTDSLVSVHWFDGVAQRMVLRDVDGSGVEIDPTVLARNPALWRRLDADTVTSLQRGTLACGVTALHQLAERIDRETAHTVFKVSGLH
ncbi:hypothetical protein OG594_16855 [Streptomyces sp. NBC_01214]|uniref:hypothetical protein n=1 Tax=Streptomyces sp. NBC_01214 TaxID=2903777 RepID=UPI00225AF59A|nr:hypothetical protein [Streptomyces sp. NBC_01214]MCX4803300.1 hypothetical protein [Streptomyces sp. NBC_01214]